jgi:eukaryotic-like serine/threonine-protein kinase
MSATSSARIAIGVDDSQRLLEAGDIVGSAHRRYRITGTLGHGGMAHVYRATHLTHGEPVAIKVVDPVVSMVPGVAERFVAEARAAMQLQNDHVVRVHAVATEPSGAHYMVMELLEGSDLQHILDTQGRISSVERAVEYVLQAAEGLAEAHGLGIVHRDLKPGNLFLARLPNGRRSIKVIDFGISKIDMPLAPTAGRLTEPGITLGSPGYMSPEQMCGASVTPSSDIWALGVILFELLSDTKPFVGDSLHALYAAATRGPLLPIASLREDVPDALDEVMARCLAAKPEDRYADVVELALALLPFAEDRRRRRATDIAIALSSARARAAHAKKVDTVDPIADKHRSGARPIHRVSSDFGRVSEVRVVERAIDSDVSPKNASRRRRHRTHFAIVGTLAAVTLAGLGFFWTPARTATAPASAVTISKPEPVVVAPPPAEKVASTPPKMVAPTPPKKEPAALKPISSEPSPMTPTNAAIEPKPADEIN